MPAPPMISHHNGRRELSISYSFAADAPETGPERLRLDAGDRGDRAQRVSAAGYTIEAAGAEATTDWFKLLVVPILLLLYAVLAISFESLTMPLLVLISVPLTILGATWALVLAGVGAGVYALVGVIALLGLTVNPAILLVDRMQRRSARRRRERRLGRDRRRARAHAPGAHDELHDDRGLVAARALHRRPVTRSGRRSRRSSWAGSPRPRCSRCS